MALFFGFIGVVHKGKMAQNPNFNTKLFKHENSPIIFPLSALHVLQPADPMKPISGWNLNSRKKPWRPAGSKWLSLQANNLIKASLVHAEGESTLKPLGMHLTTIIAAFATKTKLVWYWKNNEWNGERKENESFSQTEHLRKEIVCFLRVHRISQCFRPRKKIPHKINYWISSWWMKIKLWVFVPQKRRGNKSTRLCCGEMLCQRQGNRNFCLFLSLSRTKFVVRGKLMSLNSFVSAINFKAKGRKDQLQTSGAEFCGFFPPVLYFFYVVFQSTMSVR